MKIKNLLTSTFLLLTFASQAQLPYELVIESSTYSNLTASTSVNNDTTWDDPQFTIPIGFDFELLGETANEIFIVEEGVGGFLSTDGSGMGIIPIFIAYGADIIDRGYDLDLGPGPGSQSNISYQLEGNAGSRILKIEWRNAGFYSDVDDDGIAQDSINFQVWLYEGSNDIAIHFGPKLISQPYLAYDGKGGPLVGFFPNYNVEEDDVEGNIYLLSGDPRKPSFLEVVDLYEILFLSGAIPNGTVYRFTQVNTSINELEVLNAPTHVVPNPVRETFQLVYDRNALTIVNASIINFEGRVLRQVRDIDQAVPIADLPAGLYTLQLQTKSGQLISKKLLKQ
ncbi:MAG: T9SS type A sorting domain-containing protein [Bacteroidota bacterium]